MKYLEFITDSKDNQNFIKKSVKSLEEKLKINIRINNIIGDAAYIEVKKPKKKLFNLGVSSPSNEIIEKNIKEVFSTSVKEVNVLILEK